MSTVDPQFAEETRTLAESLLTKHFASSIQLDEPEELRGSNRSKVYRCSLTGPAHVPVSVILKRAYVKPPDHYNPDSSDILAWTLANEWASLQFLQECVPDFSMEELYRAELVKACPEAADDTLFYQAIVEASTFWMLELFEYFPYQHCSKMTVCSSH